METLDGKIYYWSTENEVKLRIIDWEANDNYRLGINSNVVKQFTNMYDMYVCITGQQLEKVR